MAQDDEENNFKYVLMKTHILKVHIHCEGCMHKVKKLLRKIKGVYEVEIEAGEHKVSVSGNVQCTTLIKKLVKSGKRAELWRANDDDDDYLSYLNSGECHEPQYPCDNEVFPRLWPLESYQNNIHNRGEKRHTDEDNISNGMGIINGTHAMSVPDYEAHPPLHGLQNSYVGLPLYQLPHAMMYTMQSPWYNHQYSMTYTNMHKNMEPVTDGEIHAFNSFSEQME